MNAKLLGLDLRQAEGLGILSRTHGAVQALHSKLGRAGSVLFATVFLLALSTALINPTAVYANPSTVTVGMPFGGKWAYDNNVNPPYTDQNSSHPSVHNAHGFNWATDLYAGANTDVKVLGSSPNGVVTFKRVSTSDTCSSQGANIAGRGVTFDVLINNVEVGEVKYDHLDLTDVGNNAIVSGTKIGEVTSEPLDPECFSARHAHVQFKNTVANYSCYTEYGNPGRTLVEGNSIGVLGSSNTNGKEACSTVSAGPGTTTLGAYNPNTATFYLRNANTPGNADLTLLYGNVGLKPIMGDWDGDGDTTLGSYDPSTATFYLRDSNTQGPADAAVLYGGVGWIPISGDWDGNGSDTIGAYEPATGKFYLRNANTPGNADYPPFQFGNANAGWLPIAGDWDGNGITSIGIYNPNTATFYLRNSNSNGPASYSLVYGAVGWKPVVGDWDGDGDTTLGSYDPSTATFYLRDSNTQGPADAAVLYGGVGWIPISGDWDGQ